MFVIAIGASPAPHFGPPKMPIIGGTPAETILQGLVESAAKKENWFSDTRQSAEAKRLAEAKAAAGDDPGFSWPKGGWHEAMQRQITVDVSDGQETYNIILTIDEGLDPSKNNKPILVRHATIQVASGDRMLDQTEAFTLLKFLGFKTTQPHVQMHPDMEALVFMEKLDAEEEQRLRSQ